MKETAPLSRLDERLERLVHLVSELREEILGARAELGRNGSRLQTGLLTRLQSMSDTLAAMEKMAADDEHERRNLRALAKIGQVINSSLDRDTVLNEVIDTIIRLTGAQRAFLMLRRDDGELETVVARNWERASLHPGEYEISTTIVNQVAHEGRPILTTNAQGDPRFQAQVSIIAYSLRSILCVPLKVKGELMGVIYADNRVREGIFTERERSLIASFAHQAAVAIENAQLYEATRNYATELEQRVRERTAELHEANANLQSLSRLKDEFVANVSHELRTPITSVKLYAALIEKRNDKHEEYVAALMRETSRLEHIVESLLRISYLDQGQVVVTPAPVNLDHLAAQYVKDRQPLAASRGLNLRFEGQADHPPALADAELIGEALSILLTNALNYTSSGGEVVISTPTKTAEGRTWVGVSVSDTGPGISPEEQPRLFQRFFRGRVGQSSGTPGTGLGLAIVKEIMDRHEGRVEVESEGVPGRGAVFTCWLVPAQ